MYIRTAIMTELSPQQKKILGRLTMGTTIPNLAKEMNLSRNTINGHLQSARTKLRKMGLLRKGMDVKALIRSLQFERALGSDRSIPIIIPDIPPSINGAYPNAPTKGGKRGRYPSRKTKEFKGVAAISIASTKTLYQHLRFPWEGRCGILCVYHLPTRGGWDLDNREKVLSDALTEGGIWIDDRLVDSIGLEIVKDRSYDYPSVETIVWEMPHA